VKPEYSLTMAHTLSVASKLAYEDVEVVRFELQKAGFDVDNTFRAIAYKVIMTHIVGSTEIFNTCFLSIIRMFVLMQLKRKMIFYLSSEGKITLI
jgi:hypothetical protein